MELNTALLSSITGIAGLIVGIVIGYYKSHAEMVSRSDCASCSLRAVVKEIGEDLDDGNKAFQQIRSDIGTIQTDIGVITALMQERAKVGG